MPDYTRTSLKNSENRSYEGMNPDLKFLVVIPTNVLTVLTVISKTQWRLYLDLWL